MSDNTVPAATPAAVADTGRIHFGSAFRIQPVAA